jgi:uncharacterized peroxidase-related enzyme
VESHAEFLRAVSLDQELADALRRNPSEAKLDAPDRAIVDFVLRMTKHPSSIIEEDVQGLRAVGFDDVAILQIAGIASFFAYFNRMADALGLGKTAVGFAGFAQQNGFAR